MKVLFFLRHQGYVRNYQSVLQELTTRGHAVHLALDSNQAAWLAGRDPLAALESPRLTVGRSPDITRRPVVQIDRALRIWLDFLRYFEPRYFDAPALRERAGSKLPAPIRHFPGLAAAPVRRILAAVLRWVDRRLPAVRVVDEFIASQRPDVVLVTPLVAAGSQQVEYVRAARRLGIPSGLCVASWDHLTNKGLIHELPDAVLVWNEAQRVEAVELHGVPAGRVVVCGAPCYDLWFDRQPSRRREQFCRVVGLRPDRPILLYLCSSPFVTPAEVPAVSRWLEALRAAGSPLAEAGVVVRPHPQNSAQWRGVDLADPHAVVWPPAGADPIDDAAKDDYFDSMFHAAAVVGVNTSGLIESAIVGRPVHTVLSPEFRATQLGTLHFAHIAGEHGMLRVAHSLAEHLEGLAASLNGSGPGEREQFFVERFVRPHGLDRRATEEFVDAVERLAGVPPV